MASISPVTLAPNSNVVDSGCTAMRVCFRRQDASTGTMSTSRIRIRQRGDGRGLAMVAGTVGRTVGDLRNRLPHDTR